MTTPAPAMHLRTQVVIATLARAVINTAQRLVYPFLPALSRGLGVPPETLAGLISLRGALGLVSPALGGLPDRIGRRFTALLGLVIFVAGLLLLGVFPSLATFAVYLFAVAGCKYMFDPALQAHLSDRTPYARRGLVIAFIELGWSGASFVGLPLIGFLIARATWRAPFLPLAAAGVAVAAALWFVLPHDVPQRGAGHAPSLGYYALIRRHPVVLWGGGLGLLAGGANELFNVVYAGWLEQAFGLTTAELGLTATVIGLAELLGEVLVMVLADKMGKRRAVAVGLLASAAAYGLIPLTGGQLPLALAGLFFVYLAFEFTLVGSLPLMTQLVPSARFRVMSLNAALHSAGRMVGAFSGPRLFALGFGWIGVAAALANLAGLALIVFLVRERHHD
ncbi:MAG: MFS transporter [Anaerolineales bacterium]|nr:MFS transporter [Anaerolineales bacterium]